MTVLWWLLALVWISSGPAIVMSGLVLIECRVFIRGERAHPGTLSGAVAVEACRRSARRAEWILILAAVANLVPWVADAGHLPPWVPFVMSWYWFLQAAFYPPLWFLPVGLVVASIRLGTYMRRAPGRWREAGWRALTPPIPGSRGHIPAI